MYGAGAQLTPTQIASIERSKAFRARIAEQAARLNAPNIEAHAPDPIVDPGPKRQWFQIVDESEREPFLTEIVIAVCNHFNVSRMDICSQRRTARVVLPRQIIYYLSRTLTKRTLPEIGRRLGNRDHTSVLFGYRKIDKLRRSDPKLDADLCALAASLGGNLT